MTTRDIQSHVQELYGLEISPSLVSQITDKIIELAREWHNRPLEAIYPIVFFDAIHYKVHDEGKIASKAAYTALAVDITAKTDFTRPVGVRGRGSKLLADRHDRTEEPWGAGYPHSLHRWTQSVSGSYKHCVPENGDPALYHPPDPQHAQVYRLQGSEGVHEGS